MEEIMVIKITPQELKEMIYASVKEAISEIKDELQREEPEVLMTRKEVAELLKISLPTLHEWTKLGRLNSYRISGRVLYKRNEVMESINARRF